MSQEAKALRVIANQVEKEIAHLKVLSLESVTRVRTRLEDLPDVLRDLADDLDELATTVPPAKESAPTGGTPLPEGEGASE